METQMLEAIINIRNVSKKKVTIGRIVTYLNNAGAWNWDKESAGANLKEMQTKGIVNENYKPLITLSSDSVDFSIIQDDVCITRQVDCDTSLVQQRTRSFRLPYLIQLLLLQK